MEIDEAQHGEDFDERRRRRIQRFRHKEAAHQELAERLANQMRLNDDALNLRWANREIRGKLNLLRNRRLYKGYWKYICRAIDTHATLGQGTADERRTIRRIIAEAFTQNDFDYIENGDPEEYAAYSVLVDIFSERVVNENQIRFADRFVEYIDIPSLEYEEGNYNYLEINRRANEYIRDRIDSLSRIVGLWVHICNRISRQFRDYNGNLSDRRDAQVKRIRNIIANVFISNRFHFAQQAEARARNFDEASILFSYSRP